MVFLLLLSLSRVRTRRPAQVVEATGGERALLTLCFWCHRLNPRLWVSMAAFAWYVDVFLVSLVKLWLMVFLWPGGRALPFHMELSDPTARGR